MASPFPADFLERQRIALVNRTIQLREVLANKRPTVGEEEPGDLGDKASILTEISCESSLSAKTFAELADIDAALTRIQRGTYGVCELTGHTIPVERLEAFPTARFSVQAQSRVEKRQRWR